MANQPTKYKKFVATAATATLVASAIVPVASAATTFTDVPADSEYTTFIDAAVEAGLMKGVNESTFGFTDSVKRSQVVIVMGRLLEQAGFKADADYATNKAFSDVSSDELLKYGNIVKNAGVFTGYTDGTLAPNANINRENMAAVFNRAAEAITGVSLVKAAADVKDVTVSDLSTALTANQPAIQALRDLGISTADNFNPKGDVQRRHFAKFAVTAVEVIKDLKVEEVAELSVKSVTTVDAETIKIELSDAIVAENSDLTKITASYVKEKATTATPISVTAELSEDGKTITLTTPTTAETTVDGETVAAQLGFEGKKVTVKVPFETLATKDKEFIAPGNFTTEFASVAPKFVAVKGSLNAEGKTNKLTLEFDKNVATIEAIKMGSTVLAKDVEVNGKEVVVTLSEEVEAGSYDLTVVNVTDYAKNVTTTATQTATLSADKTTPEVVSVSQVKDTENQVEVVLSEELATDLSATTLKATIGSFTTEAIKNIVKDTKDAKKYIVTLDDKQLTEATSTEVKFTIAKEALIDAAGNKNADKVEKAVKISLDKAIAAPTTKVVENALELTFAEKVVSPKALSTVKVTTSKGEILTGAALFTAVEVEAKEGKVVTLTAKEGVTAGDYTVVLPKGFVTDNSISKNEAAEATVKVTISEDKKATEFNVAGVTADKNVITVNFGTKVLASAVDVSKYTLNGKALTTDTAKIAYGELDDKTVDQTKVVITLADNTITTTDTAAVFAVAAGIVAVDAKVSKAFTKTIKINDNVAPEFKSVTATSVNELTFTFNEKLVDATTVDVADEVKLFDKDGKAVAFSTAKVEEGKLVINLGETVAASSVVAYEIVKVEDADLTDADLNGVKALAKTNR